MTDRKFTKKYFVFDILFEDLIGFCKFSSFLPVGVLGVLGIEVRLLVWDDVWDEIGSVQLVLSSWFCLFSLISFPGLYPFFVAMSLSGLFHGCALQTNAVFRDLIGIVQAQDLAKTQSLSFALGVHSGATLAMVAQLLADDLDFIVLSRTSNMVPLLGCFTIFW